MGREPVAVGRICFHPVSEGLTIVAFYIVCRGSVLHAEPVTVISLRQETQAHEVATGSLKRPSIVAIIYSAGVCGGNSAPRSGKIEAVLSTVLRHDAIERQIRAAITSE